MTSTVVSADTTTIGGGPTGALTIAIEAFAVAEPQPFLR
jgi:hypothetical protein